MKITLSLNKLL